jgi:hypothetical protein
MEPSARVAPEPKSAKTGVTRAVLVAATLLSGGVGVNCLLPWYTDQSIDQNVMGVLFVEGMVDLALALACFFLFLAALIRSEPKSRARLAMIGALLSIGLAMAPLELYARSAWQGMRSVYVFGLGYTGWSYGLYLAMANGFAAAALGGLAAGRLAVRKAVVPVKLESLRRPARPPGT